MNRRGFTLVEVLAAGSLLIVMLACCGQLFAASTRCLKRSANDLYSSRSCLERARALSFEQLTAAAPPGVTVTPLAEDLCLVRAGSLYTLRSKYE